MMEEHIDIQSDIFRAQLSQQKVMVQEQSADSDIWYKLSLAIYFYKNLNETPANPLSPIIFSNYQQPPCHERHYSHPLHALLKLKKGRAAQIANIGVA